MKFSEMNIPQIVQIIRAATAELTKRVGIDEVHFSEVSVQAGSPFANLKPPAPSGPLSPPDDDREFILKMATVIRSGGYVKAAERARAAEIAAEYGPWVKRQGVPTGSSAGTWRRTAGYASLQARTER